MSANNNGFKDMADYLGRLSSINPEKVTLESLTEAANFYVEKLAPRVPRSLLKKEHARDHLVVKIEKNRVKVVFEDTAFYWRFPENGTANQKAQHFASGTYQQYKEDIENIMAKKLLNLLEG